MDPSAFSFETKISLALRGKNWQELQQPAATPPTPDCGGVSLSSQNDTPADTDMAESELDEQPQESTKKQNKKRKRFEKSIARDTGDIVETIEYDSLRPIPDSVTWDNDPEILCCYNWQASTDGTNTIYVPGQPAKWQQPPLPYTLEPDSGYQYSDYNYARQPQFPYTPMFRALETMNPGYKFHDVDVLADRNNLRVLLEFTQGKANGPFRLDLYLNVNTLVIVRKESQASWWKRPDGKSYGYNLERFFTQPGEGLEDATSHYRAIRYQMGPLSVVCRFEADAYDDGVGPDECMQPQETTTTPPTPTTTAVKDIISERPTFTFRNPIRVIQKGHMIPTAQMAELKTVKHNPLKGSSVYCMDQLWFGRTSLLFTAPYEDGTGVIWRVKRDDATARIKNWEMSNQDGLRKLVSLLAELRGILYSERRANRALVLVREDKAGPVTVRMMEVSRHPVQREYFQKHWAKVPTRPGALYTEQPSQHGRGQAGGVFRPLIGRGRGRGRGQSNTAQG